MKNNTVRFRHLNSGEFFSPAPGTVGSQFVYIKKTNGVCPKYRGNGEVGVFHPYDLVVKVKTHG